MLVHKKGMAVVIGVVFLLIVWLTGNYSAYGAKEKAKVSIWITTAVVDEVLRPAENDFEAMNPGISIDIVLYPGRALLNKIAAAIPTQTAGDVIDAAPFCTMTPYIDRGYMMKAPQVALEYIDNEMLEPFRGEATYQGDVYGIAYLQGPKALYWNKKMFLEVGLTGPPTTWDELIAYSQKLAKWDTSGRLTRSGVSLRLSGGGYGVTEKWWNFLIQAGGTIMEQTTAGNWHNGYDNEAGRDALKLYIDLLYKYKVDSFMVKHDAEAFALEQTAMFDREGYVIKYLRDRAPDVDYGIVPCIGYRQRGAVDTTGIFLVTKAAKYPKEAWDFILFSAQPKYMKKMATDYGWCPVSSAIDYEEIFKEVPQMRAFFEYPEGYVLDFYPREKETLEIYTKLAQRLADAFSDGGLLDNPDGIAKVMREAGAETDSLLKEAGKYGVK